ncbi:MAG: fibrobacter succinogenes major paralogous domain-containing protein [Ignavibacteriales bacterium]|nr:fibrobacter succinogenes major paralogous domain-containing protein [Ignavibacteriales bacterium]
MKNGIIILTLISSFIMCCNTTFLNHKDYNFKVKDFVWNIKIEGQVGEIYFKGSNFIFGRNANSTFIVISPDNGAILDTLNPYTIEKERECLINDGTGEYKSGYSLHNVPVDKQKYSKVTLKSIDRQYRGDSETFYLIVNTLSNKEYTILFNRSQFDFISDITYYKDGKFIMTYNGEAESEVNKYTEHIGLFDLGKIIKDDYRTGTDSKEVFLKSEDSIVKKREMKGIKTNGSVKIGKQEWSVENLNVDRFRNGDLIPEAKTTEEWMASGENGKPAWCYYENDNEKGKKYGKLYNWYAVNDKRGMAPEGWHIPTITELKTLVTTVNNNSNVLKEIGQYTGTNTSGFSALLAGYREPHGNFTVFGEYTGFWSSTEHYNVTNAYYVYLWGNDNNINLFYSTKEYGFSVRCLKNF